MELGWAVFLAIGWMIVSVIRDAVVKASSRGMPPRRPGEPRVRDAGARPVERVAATSPGLRELLRTIEQARAKAELREPDVEFVEDATSLDQKSIEAALRRRRAAEVHEAPRTAADHGAFDARIRQEPADATGVAVPGHSGTVREAIIWREILGPPVSLRED